MDIVVDITIVEILETRDGAVYTVDAEVSEFVFGTGTRSRIRDVVVSRSVDEKDLFSLRIYDHQDVDVASFSCKVFFSSVRTADVDDERLYIDVFYCTCSRLDLNRLIVVAVRVVSFGSCEFWSGDLDLCDQLRIVCPVCEKLSLFEEF